MEVRILRDDEDTGYKYLSCRLSATVDLVSQRCDLYLSREADFAVGQELGIEGDGVRLFSAPVVKVGPGRHNQLRVVAFAKLDEIVHVNYHQEDAANILSDIIERHNYKSTGKRMDFALRGERMSLLHHWLDTVAPDKEAFMDAEGVLQVGLEPGSRVHLGKLIEEHGDWQEYRAVPVLLGQVSSQGIVRSLEYALKPTRERLRIWWSELKESVKDVSVKSSLKKTFEATKDAILGPGSIGNFSNKTIYAIMNDRAGGQPLESLVRPVPSGTILQGYIDGVVDVEGRQVLKINENSQASFDGTEFSLAKSSVYTEENLTRVKKLTGSGDDYGIYRDLLKTGGFQHEETGAYSQSMFQWWFAAQQYKAVSIP